MAAVTVQSMTGLAHEVRAGPHRLVVDEPPPAGRGEGMAPYELLLASLGS